MKHDPTCTRCKCNSCQHDRRRSLRHIIDDGGPEAFNVLMDTSTSDAERQALMAQAEGIVAVGDYMFSWKGVLHALIIGISAATLLAWATDKI